MPEVITMGEALVQFNAVRPGPLRHVTYFEKHAAGAETNVAIGMIRMGYTAGFISRVGADEFGQFLLTTLRGEGVDVSQVQIDEDKPTGIYFIQRGYPVPGRSTMAYYRRNSAASGLNAAAVNPTYFRGAKLFHVTGITPALSTTCRQAVLKAIDVAQHHHLHISFDTNIRRQLWSRPEAKTTLLPLIAKTNTVFTDPADTKILLGVTEPNKAAPKLLQMGPSTVVVKLGRKGATAFTRQKQARVKPLHVPVEDPIGAGDAFAAGFLAGILKGWSLDRTLQLASAAGALVVTVRGDYENIPTLDEALEFLRQQ